MRPPRKIDALPDSYRGREQTFVKHVILKRYLERVAWHILWTQREFVFVDGFSGPWASRSSSYEDTSFGIALRILRQVRDNIKGGHGKDCRVRCIFVEKGTGAFARLAEAAKAATYIDARAIKGRFEDRVDEVRGLIGNTFAFISVDPKGWSFDLRKLAPLLRHRPSEVIVNFMFDHVNRFLDDVRPEIRASYVLPFGDPGWRAHFDALLASGLGREEATLELFRDQLKTVGEFDYVLSARVQRPTANRSQFYLVYGTRSQKGLIEFRNVEKKAMEAEEQSRIEAQHDRRASRTRQGLLRVDTPQPVERLRQPEMAKARDWTWRYLVRMRSARYTDILIGVLERFSITESEVKDLLVNLEKSGKVGFGGMRAR